MSIVAALLAVAMLPEHGLTQAGDKVTLQLKWVTQAQFAGYYAAKAKGLYAAEKLDVTIRPGGPDIVPEQVVAGGGAQFGIDWLPSLLSARDQGAPLVNIAQVFAYSGMREIAFKSSGIKGAADLKGRNVAVWFGGNEFELLATLDKYKIDRNKDVTLIQQPFDMNLLLQKKVDAAAAMTYNEYKQVLDAGVKADDLVVIDFNKEGTAMLEDGDLRQGRLDRGCQEQGHRRSLPARVPQGLGALQGQARRVRGDRAEGEPRARPRPSDLDDGRDQQAHLGAAGAQEPARQDGSGGVQADGRDRVEVRRDQEARR